MKTWWLTIGGVFVVLVLAIELFHESGQQNDCVDRELEEMIELQKELNQLYKDLIELEELKHKLIIGKAWSA